MLKMLFILRCYSGFEKSLIRKEWSPSGAPTIVKLLEHVQKNKECNILFLSKSNNTQVKLIKDRIVKLKKLSIPIHFIRGHLVFLGSTKLGKVYNELYNLLFTIYYVIKLKPKIIYAASNFHIKSWQQRIKFEFNLLSILDSGTKTELKNYLEAT